MQLLPWSYLLFPLCTDICFSMSPKWKCSKHKDLRNQQRLWKFAEPQITRLALESPPSLLTQACLGPQSCHRVSFPHNMTNTKRFSECSHLNQGTREISAPRAVHSGEEYEAGKTFINSQTIRSGKLILCMTIRGIHWHDYTAGFVLFAAQDGESTTTHCLGYSLCDQAPPIRHIIQ